ncbi:histone-fold-containing protein [Immersiella caudata]|uniref:Histone-fold-containing protein n=1 Tax=Immersiella caudata TaxID=314043 RepID=A0AA40C0D8_9PEZI|nr:histone-fold-containing protein [Immersiella caudata]
MPYNTTAIPPRKEVTGQTQLPLTRVKKIIAVDPDIAVCSNNAAFVITLATELFIQHFVTEGQNMAKMERKPRRNIQYKDLANAVSHHDNLEFLEDVIPKTTTYKQVKNQAAATRAKLKGEKTAEAPDGREDDVEQPNGKKQKSIMNGTGTGSSSTNGFSRAQVLSDEDPSSQLELEMRQAQRAPGDGDVDMTG